MNSQRFTWNMDAQTFDAILSGIASGESAKACLREHSVNPGTFWGYLGKDEDAANQYARARVRGLDRMAEEILDIADDNGGDWIEDKVNPEVVARARLRVDSRKWLLSKLVPKKYGDKVTQEHTGADGGAILTRVENVIIDPKNAG